MSGLPDFVFPPWSLESDCSVVDAHGATVAYNLKPEHARLIAAAPDLLSALEDALAALDAEGACTATCIACDDARAAIAKATEAPSPQNEVSPQCPA